MNKQIAILEEEINKEKKRQKKELLNLQAALDENEKLENLQENVNSIMVYYFKKRIYFYSLCFNFAKKAERSEAKRSKRSFVPKSVEFVFLARSFPSLFLRSAI